jgi:hypothetical protein
MRESGRSATDWSRRGIPFRKSRNAASSRPRSCEGTEGTAFGSGRSSCAEGKRW